ncbi:hypothetical protein SNEBB_004919 [Seison nebaliae]|nr:hypothetical protein SNEBB_004919 [Seison nebaliae]
MGNVVNRLPIRSKRYDLEKAEKSKDMKDFHPKITARSSSSNRNQSVVMETNSPSNNYNSSNKNDYYSDRSNEESNQNSIDESSERTISRNNSNNSSNTNSRYSRESRDSVELNSQNSDVLI